MAEWTNSFSRAADGIWLGFSAHELGLAQATSTPNASMLHLQCAYGDDHNTSEMEKIQLFPQLPEASPKVAWYAQEGS
jgi:hypothetical protein